MLLNLSVTNVVLIDRLNLSFGHGLSIFTGETGAGKSILLDALSMALGARADLKLIRHGASECSVSAVFNFNQKAVTDFLRENAIPFDSAEREVILRRVLTSDGKSKAFINDVPVSIGSLKKIGDMLIEIHGQFESHSLLNPATHKSVLDNYAGLSSELDECRQLYDKMISKERELKELKQKIDKAKEEEEYLRHSVKELDALKIEKGEEEELASRRSFLMNSEKMVEYIKAAYDKLSGEVDLSRFLKDAEFDLEKAESVLEKEGSDKSNSVSEIAGSVNEASDKLFEAVSGIEKLLSDIDNSTEELEQVEERLFALRELARKHRVMVDDLPDLLEKFRADLNAIEIGEEGIKQKEEDLKEAKDTYSAKAMEIHNKRVEAGKRLDALVLEELAPLKLEKASIKTKVEKLEEDHWGGEGFDAVHFYASTNPGTPKELIHKIASGGELSRFMLALKVVLSKSQAVPTYIFDEVDTGISGATASAVGERLARLSKTIQVLVITHSAQVAAFGDHHFKVLKHGHETVVTTVVHLKHEERIKEIARIISSNKVTDEALLQAENLLGKS
jgi:DNA repair protein RecN (Recombination protein N)